MRILLCSAFAALLVTGGCNAKQETVKEQKSAENWSIQPETTVAFTSVKNKTLPVSGKFTDVTGTVDLARFPELDGSIQVNIASLDTGNPGRDQNITVYFFEAGQEEFARAEFLPQRFAAEGDAALGDSPVEGNLVGTLKLHGEELEVALPVRIVKSDSTLHVESTAEAKVSIASLDMQAQKGKLIEVCAHESIEDAVAIKLDARFARRP
jgi:polyisoprenoid-binding protein YceI